MTDTKLCTVAWRVALSSCFSLFARSNWPRSRASSGSSPSREAVRVRLIWVHCQLNPRAVVRGVVSAAAHVFGCIIGSWAALSWCLGGWPTPRGDKLLVLESLLGGTSPLSRRPPANARPPGPREGHMNCDNDILNVLAFRGVLGTSGLVGCGLFEEDAFVLLGLPMFGGYEGGVGVSVGFLFFIFFCSKNKKLKCIQTWRRFPLSQVASHVL
eukprot:c19921_g1_i2.p1 GENE.c19921_g1_i2~~c19921_g1_i2.p1  ORF type:complete len:213 (+),score=24.29 c19921_g1_i2:816-1454(+)